MSGLPWLQYSSTTTQMYMHSTIRYDHLSYHHLLFSFLSKGSFTSYARLSSLLKFIRFDRSYYYLLFLFFFNENKIISDVARLACFQSRVSNDHSLLVLTTLVLYNHTSLASGPSHQPVRPVSYRFTPCHLPVGRLTNCRAV